MKSLLLALLLIGTSATIFIVYRLFTTPLIIIYNAWKPPYGIDWTFTVANNGCLLLAVWIPYIVISEYIDKRKKKENDLINQIGEN